MIFFYPRETVGAGDERRVYIARRPGASRFLGWGRRGRKRGEVMGRYIDEILQPGEKVLYSTNAHWIFYLPAIGAWIVALILVIISRETTVQGVTLLALASAAVVALVALYWTVRAWFHRLTTETDVTNKRVVHKTGFIKRRTFELAIDKIE